MNSVVSHLQQADIFIILCSQYSLDRPWINLELGAALTRGKTIIPLCHTDLLAAQLVRRPLSDFEALNASDPEGLKSLFTKLAKALGSRVPAIDWAQLVERGAGLRIEIPGAEADHLPGQAAEPVQPETGRPVAGVARCPLCLECAVSDDGA